MAGRICSRMCTTLVARSVRASPLTFVHLRTPPNRGRASPRAPSGDHRQGVAAEVHVVHVLRGATRGTDGSPDLGDHVVGSHTGLSGANLIRLTRRQRLRAAEEEHPPERLPPGLSFRGKPDGTTGRREHHTAAGPGQLVAGGLPPYPGRTPAGARGAPPALPRGEPAQTPRGDGLRSRAESG